MQEETGGCLVLSHEACKHCSPMRLRGQHGYAMAALLVGLGIMAIMMTVVMPVWEASRPAREGSRADLPRRAVRASHRAVRTKAARGPASQPGRPRRPAVPAQKVQGSDHRRRLRPRQPCRSTGSPTGRTTRRAATWTTGRSNPDNRAASKLDSRPHSNPAGPHTEKGRVKSPPRAAAEAAARGRGPRAESRAASPRS